MSYLWRPTQRGPLACRLPARAISRNGDECAPAKAVAHFSRLYPAFARGRGERARYKRASQTLSAHFLSWPITRCVLLSVKPIFGLMGVTSSLGHSRSFS